MIDIVTTFVWGSETPRPKVIEYLIGIIREHLINRIEAGGGAGLPLKALAVAITGKN